jgi:glycerate 2-kinase
MSLLSRTAMLIDPSKLMTSSLRHSPRGETIARILSAALDAVDPAAAVNRFLRREGNLLDANGRTYDLDLCRHIYLVGAGKAGAPMARAAASIIGDKLTCGRVVVKEGYADLEGEPADPRVEIMQAGHPLPDERGVAACRRITDLVSSSLSDDLLICVISGGGSALLTSPVMGVSLADMQSLTADLLRRGANIGEINTLRKHLDSVKGGGLARMAPHTPKIVLVLSDVVGDRLDVIASGPCCPDASTFQDAWKVLERFDLQESAPPAILEALRCGLRGDTPENPKPDDPLFSLVQHIIVGSNLQAARAAQSLAEQEAFHAVLVTTSLQGEARQAGLFMSALARQVDSSSYPASRPACLIVGGETTVTLTGKGLGGRNQEAALAAVAGLSGLEGVILVTLATDGGDGPTDAAGAVVSGETLTRALQLGLDPVHFLAENDSYHFFAPLDDLLHPGPTCTNVNDLSFVFIY